MIQRFLPRPKRSQTPPPPIVPATHIELLRNGLVLAIDMIKNITDVFEVLANPLVDDKTKAGLIATTQEVNYGSFGALVEIEAATRPTLNPDFDLAYLNKLYSLEDDRKHK